MSTDDKAIPEADDVEGPTRKRGWVGMCCVLSESDC